MMNSGVRAHLFLDNKDKIRKWQHYLDNYSWVKNIFKISDEVIEIRIDNEIPTYFFDVRNFCLSHNISFLLL